MNIKPRYLVLLLFIFLGGVNPSNAAPTPVDPKVLHIINRLSFGPRPGDVERVESIGVENYIKEQLSPDSIPEPLNLTNQLSQLETLSLNPVALYKEYEPARQNGQKPTPEEMKAARQRAKVVVQQATQARLLPATESPRQLQEVMVDFWFNHFNVYSDKGLDRIWVGAYEQEAIRPHVLGRFRDLLEATARHPAMLFYLDNWQNSAPRRNRTRASQGLNEN